MSKANAIILCRISDQKQDDGYSLDAQERVGIEYCTKKALNVLKIFRFIETGSKSGKRQKFDAMMEFIKAYIDNKKNIGPLSLVVEKPDRLTRNFTNREQIQFFVMLGRLEIHFYKDRRVMDQNCSPADIFTDDMMTSVSKYIALNIAREVKKGLGEKARNGWYPAHPPIGYKYTRDGSVGKHGRREARIIIDETTKPIIYRIFELRAVEKRSYEFIGNTIRQEFLNLGPSKYKFNRSSIEKILLNRFYGGTFEWMGSVFQGKHEPFVPPTWIDIAQGRMRGKPNKAMPVGSLSHFLKCGVPECGCQVIYDPKKKINKTTGDEREYHYYHCTDGKGVHKALGLSQVNASENRLWEQLATAATAVSIPETVANNIVIQYDEHERESFEAAKLQHQEAASKLESLIKKQDQLYEDMTRDLIDEDDFRRLKAKLREEIQSLRLKLENNYESEKEKVRDRLKITLELAKDADINWNLSTPSDRVVFLKNVLSNFSLEGATLRYDLKNTYKILSQIKNKAVSEKWCAKGDLNPHAEAHAPQTCVSTNSTIRATASKITMREIKV